MVDISDDFMREMLGRSREYTIVMLKDGPNADAPERPEITWEHGRRNFALREEGVLAIVCPILDDSPWCGIGIFDASAEEAARIMDGDPGVQAGVFAYEIHPSRSFAGDTLPA